MSSSLHRIHNRRSQVTPTAADDPASTETAADDPATTELFHLTESDAPMLEEKIKGQPTKSISKTTTSHFLDLSVLNGAKCWKPRLLPERSQTARSSTKQSAMEQDWLNRRFLILFLFYSAVSPLPFMLIHVLVLQERHLHRFCPLPQTSTTFRRFAKKPFSLPSQRREADAAVGAGGTDSAAAALLFAVGNARRILQHCWRCLQRKRHRRSRPQWRRQQREWARQAVRGGDSAGRRGARPTAPDWLAHSRGLAALPIFAAP